MTRALGLGRAGDRSENVFLQLEEQGGRAGIGVMDRLPTGSLPPTSGPGCAAPLRPPESSQGISATHGQEGPRWGATPQTSDLPRPSLKQPPGEKPFCNRGEGALTAHLSHPDHQPGVPLGADMKGSPKQAPSPQEALLGHAGCHLDHCSRPFPGLLAGLARPQAATAVWGGPHTPYHPVLSSRLGLSSWGRGGWKDGCAGAGCSEISISSALQDV